MVKQYPKMIEGLFPLRCNFDSGEALFETVERHVMYSLKSMRSFLSISKTLKMRSNRAESRKSIASWN